MNFWEYLDRRSERRFERDRRIFPSDFRGWLALGLFVQSCALFALMKLAPELTENQGFMTLASGVIMTGWVGGAIAFAFSAGKDQGERTGALNKALDLAAGAQDDKGAAGNKAQGAKEAAGAAKDVADDLAEGAAR